MNKKGFTLIELLVVIVIIAVLSIVIVPSLIKINDNINKRLLSEKIENIESAAQLYARNNEEIFNGTTRVRIYVYQLVEYNYLTIDIKDGSNNCKEDGERGIDSDNKTNKGCVQNPVNKSAMNGDYVELTRNGTGYKAEYFSTTTPDPDYNPTTLVRAVCMGFETGTYKGQTKVGDETKECKCDREYKREDKEPSLVLSSDESTTVTACIISGDSPQNYLRYGSNTDPNWRVLGLYQLEDGKLSAKLITIGPIKE